MSRAHRTVVVLALLGVVGLLGTVAGCETGQREEGVQAAQSREHSPADAMTQSDAQRAEAAIERDRREMSGERRPVDPSRPRVVDQPRSNTRR